MGKSWNFPRIPDEPSKPQNFLPSKLLSFTVFLSYCKLFLELYESIFEKSLGEILNLMWAPHKLKLEWKHQAWKAAHTVNLKVNLFNWAASVNTFCVWEKLNSEKLSDILDFSLVLQVAMAMDTRIFKMPVVWLELVAFHYDVTVLLQNVTYIL